MTIRYAVAVLGVAISAPGNSSLRLPQQCRMEVVHCNYGPLYSGTMQWIKSLNMNSSSANVTATSQRTETVTATVTNGKAICAGTLNEDRNTTGDQPTRGKLRSTISGPGLFAVEFDKDESGKLYYLVTVACPSEAGTDSTFDLKTGGKDGELIEATAPKLDGREMQSDKQPATAVGVSLSGTITFTNPDEDRLNGVTGSVTVKWDLKRP